MPFEPEPPGLLEKGISSASNHLHDEQDKAQLRTFTLWWNSHLEPHGITVTDLCEEIRGGVILLRLLEALEGCTFAPVARGKIRMAVGSKQQLTANPSMKMQKIENLNLCLNALTDTPPPHGVGKGIRLVNIGAEDLAGDGREHTTLVLGLTWEIFKFYELSSEKGFDQHAALLEWVRAETKGYRDVEIGNAPAAWTTSFRDGKAFCALVHKHAPSRLDYKSVENMSSSADRLREAFLAAESLGAPSLLDASAVAAGKVDAPSMKIYLVMLRKAMAELVALQAAGLPIDATEAEASEARLAKEKANAEAVDIAGWAKAQAVRKEIEDRAREEAEAALLAAEAKKHEEIEALVAAEKAIAVKLAAEQAAEEAHARALAEAQAKAAANEKAAAEMKAAEQARMVAEEARVAAIEASKANKTATAEVVLARDQEEPAQIRQAIAAQEVADEALLTAEANAERQERLANRLADEAEAARLTAEKVFAAEETLKSKAAKLQAEATHAATAHELASQASTVAGRVAKEARRRSIEKKEVEAAVLQAEQEKAEKTIADRAAAEANRKAMQHEKETRHKANVELTQQLQSSKIALHVLLPHAMHALMDERCTIELNESNTVADLKARLAADLQLTSPALLILRRGGLPLADGTKTLLEARIKDGTTLTASLEETLSSRLASRTPIASAQTSRRWSLLALVILAASTGAWLAQGGAADIALGPVFLSKIRQIPMDAIMRDAMSKIQVARGSATLFAERDIAPKPMSTEAASTAQAQAEDNARRGAKAEAKAKEEAQVLRKAKALAEEEARLAAEAMLKAEEETKLALEAKAKAEAEVRRASEAKGKAEEETRLALEAKGKATEEARLAAEVRAKAEDETRLMADANIMAKAEEEARVALAAKADAEKEARVATEAKSKAKEEARLAWKAKAKAEEEARLARAKAEEEARLAKSKAEEGARLARAKAEEEARLAKSKAEEEVRLAKSKAEEEVRLAKAKAEEEARLAIVKEKAEADALLAAEAHARTQEAARVAAEADAKLKAEEKARLSAEAEAKAEEEARLALAAKADAEKEAHLAIEAKSKAKEEARLAWKAKAKAEEETRLAIAAKEKAEADALLAAEAHERTQEAARIAAEVDAKAKAEEKARLSAEVEAKARVEAETRASAEARARAEELARVAAETETKAKAEEQARLAARAKAEVEDEWRLASEATAEAEKKAHRAAETKAKADEEMRLALEAKAIAKKEAQLAKEAKEKAQAETRAAADTKARAEEAKVNAEKEARLAAEAKKKAKEDVRLAAEAMNKATAETRRAAKIMAKAEEAKIRAQTNATTAAQQQAMEKASMRNEGLEEEEDFNRSSTVAEGRRTDAGPPLKLALAKFGMAEARFLANQLEGEAAADKALQASIRVSRRMQAAGPLKHAVKTHKFAAARTIKEARELLASFEKVAQEQRAFQAKTAADEKRAQERQQEEAKRKARAEAKVEAAADAQAKRAAKAKLDAEVTKVTAGEKAKRAERRRQHAAAKQSKNATAKQAYRNEVIPIVKAKEAGSKGATALIRLTGNVENKTKRFATETMKALATQVDKQAAKASALKEAVYAVQDAKRREDAEIAAEKAATEPIRRAALALANAHLESELALRKTIFAAHRSRGSPGHASALLKAAIQNHSQHTDGTKSLADARALLKLLEAKAVAERALLAATSRARRSRKTGELVSDLAQYSQDAEGGVWNCSVCWVGHAQLYWLDAVAPLKRSLFTRSRPLDKARALKRALEFEATRTAWQKLPCERRRFYIYGLLALSPRGPFAYRKSCPIPVLDKVMRTPQDQLNRLVNMTTSVPHRALQMATKLQTVTKKHLAQMVEATANSSRYVVYGAAHLSQRTAQAAVNSSRCIAYAAAHLSQRTAQAAVKAAVNSSRCVVYGAAHLSRRTAQATVNSSRYLAYAAKGLSHRAVQAVVNTSNHFVQIGAKMQHPGDHAIQYARQHFQDPKVLTTAIAAALLAVFWPTVGPAIYVGGRSVFGSSSTAIVYVYSRMKQLPQVLDAVRAEAATTRVARLQKRQMARFVESARVSAQDKAKAKATWGGAAVARAAAEKLAKDQARTAARQTGQKVMEEKARVKAAAVARAAAEKLAKDQARTAARQTGQKVMEEKARVKAAAVARAAAEKLAKDQARTAARQTGQKVMEEKARVKAAAVARAATEKLAKDQARTAARQTGQKVMEEKARVKAAAVARAAAEKLAKDQARTAARQTGQKVMEEKARVKAAAVARAAAEKLAKDQARTAARQTGQKVMEEKARVKAAAVARAAAVKLAKDQARTATPKVTNTIGQKKRAIHGPMSRTASLVVAAAQAVSGGMASGASKAASACLSVFNSFKIFGFNIRDSVVFVATVIGNGAQVGSKTVISIVLAIFKADRWVQVGRWVMLPFASGVRAAASAGKIALSLATTVCRTLRLSFLAVLGQIAKLAVSGANTLRALSISIKTTIARIGRAIVHPFRGHVRSVSLLGIGSFIQWMRILRARAVEFASTYVTVTRAVIVIKLNNNALRIPLPFDLPWF